ncbi:MAG: transglutaminase family protein [Vicinamibacterales bacterium]
MDPRGPERDFTDLHAWCEVYLPGAGWIGLDPTSGLLAGEGHLPLACTPDPTTAAPITGAVETCEVEFTHEMSVQRIVESPRVTRPYTDEQWAAIVDLGHAVDAHLHADDVRLTMGGEPTFVSATDRNGAEWKTDALGPTKRFRALDLLWRLKTHYGANGFIHVGQGKSYRANSCRDGHSVVTGAWMASRRGPTTRYGPTKNSPMATHRRMPNGSFARSRRSWPSPTSTCRPDTKTRWYYLWRERRLPTNVNPFESRLDDELERARLHRVFSRGLDTIVGYALPIMATGPSAWTTGPWFLRAERMYLIPGDSPMGFRLPLDSLPWSAASDRHDVFEPDPFASRAPLPSYAARPRHIAGAVGDPVLQRPTRIDASRRADGSDGGHADAIATSRAAEPLRGESALDVVRFALCVEPRGGVLYVFMPPVGSLESYLDLVAAIERTASRLRMRVLIEGYQPPHDPRLSHFLITPDPGVIEVNIQPASDWDALVEQTTTLYEEARQAGLSTETFQLDGRHTGTGGGNHFVLGGASASDSPFLRRPDLLRSLIAYWHNHPSLSYLFSGLFIGPTESGTASRRSAARQCVRTRDRLFETA